MRCYIISFYRRGRCKLVGIIYVFQNCRIIHVQVDLGKYRSPDDTGESITALIAKNIQNRRDDDGVPPSGSETRPDDGARTTLMCCSQFSDGAGCNCWMIYRKHYVSRWVLVFQFTHSQAETSQHIRSGGILGYKDILDSGSF